MRAIKKINNNVAICIDGNGNQLVAFGRGIGFPPMPYELTDLKQVERTFYDISGNYVDMINDIPEDVIRFTALMLDSARAILPYELMPNLILTMADHIAFCIERHRKGIYVRMPLVYEISQTYPLEMKIAQYILREMEKSFGVKVNPREASGIALSILNARVDAKSADSENSELNQKHFDYIQEEVTRMIEREFRFSVDRASFGFARFSTHLQHLCERLTSGEEVATENSRMYMTLKKEYPQIDECAEKIKLFLERELQCSVSDEEKLYLILHINRISANIEV